MRIVLAVLALAGFCLCQSDTVMTSLGSIRGTVYSDARGFTGIPFAESTAGANRWQPPVPKAAWAPNTLIANTTLVGCPQTCMLPPNNCPLTQSEDCLMLNVWTPLTQSKTGLPVMMFLPGGRFEQGVASSVLYNGRSFANTTNVILVTAAYRLGSLGFLATGNVIKGNFGFMDQILALKWIQSNIAAFGGDPTQVTLFGQSAGASSTSCHLTSPLTQNLFNRAILESTPLSLAMKPLSDMANGLGKLFASNIGCAANDLKCFQGKTVEQVLHAQDSTENHLFPAHPLDLFLPWTPVVDGVILTAQPVDLLAKGQIPSFVKSVTMGTVMNEAVMFIDEGFTKPISEAEYLAVILAIFGPLKAPRVLARYPCTAPNRGDCRPVMNNVTTPFVFACPTRYALRGIAKKLPTTSFMYRFDHVLSFSKEAWGPNYTFCDDKVCHGSELPFVFNSAQYAGFSFTPGEQQLSTLMMQFWGNLGTSGTPNTGSTTPSLHWSALGPNGNQNYMEFATPSSAGNNLDEDACNFWDTIGYDY